MTYIYTASKSIKNDIFLTFTILFTLIFSNSAFAWDTNPDSPSGYHPELLAQSTCTGNDSNYYLSTTSNNFLNHTYTGYINGMAIYGNGSGGANTGLGIGGDGIYETGGKKYFVGPLYKTTTSKLREPGRDGNYYTATNHYYQICIYGAVVYSYTTTQDQAAGCPADRPSGYILQRRSYEVWTDGSTRNFGGWYNVADYCSAVYSYTGYNYTTGACPATQPSGVVNMRQSYEVWSDGSIRNYSGWVATSNTCVAAYQSTESRSQALACTVPYAEGGNGITQTSSRQIWSDGARAWSAWATVSNTCYKTVSDVKDNSRKTCAEGQTGYRITEWRRTHKEYSANSGKTPAEIAALNEQNATVWTEVEVANTCVNVADKVTKEPGTRLLTCASVYGGSASDYTGEVVESGTKVYTYSSVTKQTTTTFVSNTPPSYNSTCKSTVSDIVTETDTKACPAGFSGTITSYRYVATDSKGVKTYPNGTNFIESSNTCVSNGASIDDSSNVSNATKSKGLLANNTIKTSSLSTRTDLESFINTLDKTTMDKDSSYKLHLIADDLSVGKYNKSNVTKTVNAFKSVTGQDPIIVLPQSLDKYIGNGGITQSNYKNKVLKSAILKGNTATITYSELSKGLSEGAEKTFTVDLY
jgi:hypothetical protein